MKNLRAISAVIVALIICGSAQATVVSFHSSAASGLFSGTTNGQALENAFNTYFFNPLNTEIEFGVIDGGTSAVDHMQYEGPGVVVITGFGFMVRFTDAVSDVRVQFSNHKDDANVTLRAFSDFIDYPRSTTAFNQHVQGNPTGFPDISSLLDTDFGTIPAGNDGSVLDLFVNDPSAGIHTIFVNTNKFLTSLTEIEFETTAAPVAGPGALGIMGLGLLGLGFVRRRA